MSFFIRKKSKNLTNLTGQGDKEAGRPRNKDFKPRPAAAARKTRGFGGKRKKPFGPVGKEVEKKGKFDDEEISSSEDEGDGEGGKLMGKKFTLDKLKRSDESVDSLGSAEEDQASGEGEDEEETAQEKRVRLAKLYIEEIAKKEKGREEDTEIDKELIASRLKEDVLEGEGRLRREIADLVEPDLEKFTVLTCSKYLKRSVTCLCISEDDNWIFSGSKDGHILKWSVAEKRKVGIIKRKEILTKKKKRKNKGNNNSTPLNDECPNAAHSSAVTAIAISSSGKFLASGDLDGKLAIWDPITLRRIHIFTGHRGAIRSICFRKKKHTLYSASNDRSVRVWDLDAMGYVESLFGHQDAVTCIDALTRERAVTGGGRDNTVRVWKIVEESQLVYNGHYQGNIDAIKLVNEENFVSCGDDGLICTWNVNRKKPLFSLEDAHGTFKSFPELEYESPRWVATLGAWTNTDLIASGSSDGHIRFWKCGERFKSLSPAFTVPIPGFVNALEFSAANDSSPEGMLRRPKFVVAGVGKEHRLGRWFEDIKDAKNGLVLIPLKHKENISSTG